MADQLILDFTAEIWKPVVGWPDYEVSSLGRVRRASRGKGTTIGRVLKPYADERGYMRISLCGGRGRTKKVKIQGLVCTAFHGTRPSPKHESAHGDGNPRNNRADNLRWATKKENEADKIAHGTYQFGKLNPSNKLSEDDIREIRRRYAAREATQRILAAEYGIHQVTVSEIILRKIWGWL